MSYDINGVTGDWGPGDWLDPTGTVANNGPQVVGNDVLTNATVTQGSDRWTGLFQNILGNVAQYAIQRDAAHNGLAPTVAANGQPVYGNGTQYVPINSTGGVNMGAVLIVGGAILAGVLIVAVTKKG